MSYMNVYIELCKKLLEKCLDGFTREYCMFLSRDEDEDEEINRMR